LQQQYGRKFNTGTPQTTTAVEGFSTKTKGFAENVPVEDWAQKADWDIWNQDQRKNLWGLGGDL
jgi:hypothetical protein